jgi:hypothetical protein
LSQLLKAVTSHRTPKTKKPLHLNQKGWNGHRVAVSPFDGVNRIRFKGSLNIADLQLPIAD